MKVTLALVCLATALIGASPQQPAEPIRVGIDYVYVDVVVTDRNGEPVRDLKAKPAAGAPVVHEIPLRVTGVPPAK